MSKYIDKIILSSILIFIIFATIYLNIKNFFFSITLSLLIYLLIVIVYKSLKKHTNKNISYIDFINYLALQGNNYTVNLIFEIIEEKDKKIFDNCIIVNDTAIFPIIKFSNISMDNIANVYNFSKKNNLTNIKIIYSNIDKKTLLFANNLDVNIDFINANLLYNKLKKYKKLPYFDNNNIIKHKKNKDVIKYLNNSNTSRKLTILGLFFIALSFITPLKIYYLVIGSITIFISILPHIITGIKKLYDKSNNINKKI